jgi:hypothetical protein
MPSAPPCRKAALQNLYQFLSSISRGSLPASISRVCMIIAPASVVEAMSQEAIAAFDAGPSMFAMASMPRLNCAQGKLLNCSTERAISPFTVPRCRSP